jgi:hypothetical protein
MLLYEMPGDIFDEYMLPMLVQDVIIKYLEPIFLLFSIAKLVHTLHIFVANIPKPASSDRMCQITGAPLDANGQWWPEDHFRVRSRKVCNHF